MTPAERERAYSPSSCLEGGDYRPFVDAYTSRSREAVTRAEGLGAMWSWPRLGSGETPRIAVCVPAQARAAGGTAGGEAAPLLVFIHGGYWQELSARDSLFAAAACVERGAAFAALDYTLAPQASVAQIVRECERMLAWLVAQAPTLHIDPARIVVAGSSAGAHLAAMVSRPGAAVPGWRPMGAVLVSGIYDLEPLIGTSINDALRLDLAQAHTSSPALLTAAGFAPAVVCWGEVETHAFKQQSIDFAARLAAAGVPCQCFEVTSRNHFDVILDLADPDSTLGRATFDLLGSYRAPGVPRGQIDRTNMSNITREHCEQRDLRDPLAPCRQRFALPQGVIYLDGNSLGALVASVAPRMALAVTREWGQGLIRSWNDALWYPAPLRVGARIAQLVGAQPHEVVVCDSTSVNLFKVLVSALRLRPGRRVILGETGNFPTDMYVAAGVAELMGAELQCVEPEAVEHTIASLGERLAVVTLTEVNYKTGRLHDMRRVTVAAHAAGALACWDLAHSAGTLPVALNDCDADFAVGCGYKYLNGGPGAPAFVFVAQRHLASLRQPIAGWHGHARPFDFAHDYEAHAGIDRMLVGTAPQLSLIALEEALTAFDGVDLQHLRRKGSELGDLFIALVEQRLGDHGFGLASPRDAAQRGSQVSLTHPQGYAIIQALIARVVIGDFRAPDILRFGFAGLYVRYVDVWEAVAQLDDVMRTRAWDRPEFLARKAVT